MALKTVKVGPKVIVVGVRFPSSWTEEQYEAYLEELAEYLGERREDIEDVG